MIINGAMNVAQRSASVAGIGASAGYFTCDRWQIDTGSSAGRLTMSQTSDGPNGISANCIKLDCTTADTSIAANEYLILAQRFEGQNLQRIGKGVVGAKQITVSFYVKASAAFDFVIELIDRDNDRQCSKLFSTTTGWVRHEFLTYAADVDDGSSPFDDNNAASLDMYFWLHSGATYKSGTLNTAAFANTTQANRAAGIDSFYSSTDNNFFLTGVQMEVGPVATDFEQEEISTTLSKCQRYYQRIESSSGVSVNANYAQFNVPFPVEMRATPAASISDANGLACARITDHYAADTTVTSGATISLSNSSKNGARVQIGSFSGLTQTRFVGFLPGGSYSSFMRFDAEL